MNETKAWLSHGHSKFTLDFLYSTKYANGTIVP